MTIAEIIQIILGSLSLLATIGVSFAIYWLQLRHEKEIENVEKKQKQKELEEKAHIFLNENSNERVYLPWCVIAANLHRHENHTKKIYKNFCLCNKELQNEILKQAGFSLQMPNGQDWVDECFNKVNEDIKKYKLGTNYLYDGAKYFHRGFLRYRELPYKLDDLHSQIVGYNESYTKANFYDSKILLDEYFDHYFECVMGECDFGELGQDKPIPPSDYFWQMQGLGTAEEPIVCYWIMEFVLLLAINVYNRNYSGPLGPMFENNTDAQVITYEDQYYKTLLWLYYTYFEPQQNDNNKE